MPCVCRVERTISKPTEEHDGSLAVVMLVILQKSLAIIVVMPRQA